MTSQVELRVYFINSELKTVLRLFLGIFILMANGLAQSDEPPVNWKNLPDPFHTASSNNGPRVIARPPGAKLKVPSGFQVDEYLSGFYRPRFMLYGPGGEIIMTDIGDWRRANGTVYVLKDKQRKKILQDLDRPYGMVLHKGWLYVAEPTSVKRYKYNSQTMSVSSSEEIISLPGFGRGHITRTLLFDRQGEKLYVSIGSETNVDVGEPPMRATITRFNTDGSEPEIFASGLRNVVGMRWYPESDNLWATVQERDYLGDDLVPDYLVNVKKGGFYGWPYAYIGPHPEPRHKGLRPDMIEKTLYPDVLLGAHVAALDALFYTGKQFPGEYQGGCFIAFHGSWNRSKRAGYRVAFIPFRDGRPLSDPQDFLTGWMLGEDKREVWGRPVGLLQMTDGSLLISEDGNGTLWRVSYRR